jgi:TolB-like protein/Tfp pilus assembly protein PilF
MATDAAQTVFLSYASEDAAAAQRISTTLRAAGIEVWFDQSELRGGDVWDQQIRQRIHDCALFIPVISAHTEQRREGYFRREWRLAVDRTHDMSDRTLFVVPVVIDATREKGADVPESFLKVQWTHLPGGETPPAFGERIRALLVGGGEAPVPPRADISAPSRAIPRRQPRYWIVVCAAGAAVALLIGWQAWRLRRASPPQPPAPVAATFNPPPRSIAVLPFVNMSGDKEQEYFSEGLTEELLNSLARMNELQVAARTSSFSFEGQHPDIATVAHKLNVGAVLEGSVRRSGHTVRITTQLVNGVTGFHLWSQTYDRDLGDVLKLQTEIANAVASALKVTLLGDVTAKIELGGTRNPAALDAYLRASKIYRESQTEKELQTAIEEYGEAIRRDPGYALAYSDRAIAFSGVARNWAKGPAVRSYGNKARADARRAIELAPDLAEGHLALAEALAESLEFTPASQEYARALALAPGNVKVLGHYGEFAVQIGHTESGVSAARKAVQLDPLNSAATAQLGYTLLIARRYDESISALRPTSTLDPSNGPVNASLAFAYYWSGDYRNALASCERADELNKGICMALIYEKLGRHADAESALANYRNLFGDDASVFYAMIYAEWGDNPRALDNLETAIRLRNPYLWFVKADFELLRQEPRFQAMVRELKFPD